jgi:hypothetical protein
MSGGIVPHKLEFEMKHNQFLLVLFIIFSSVCMSQRLHETHTRSMLRQTVYNTGELGRALEGSNSNTIGILDGTSSLEWPPNSVNENIDGYFYWGQQNGFGSGLLVRALVQGKYETRACGGITDGSGNATAIAGVYVQPGPISRIENYPVLENGELNAFYNPNEAEEIITANYKTLPPINLSITQTSRAWSYPGYDSFIIIEYDIVNRDTVDYTDGMVMFQNAFSPSAFGIMRKYDYWNESSMTSRSREEYARYNFSRLLTYVHPRNGFPDATYFDKWSAPNDRGGLDSPQAIGFLPLHYEYDLLQAKANTSYVVSDSARVWDANGKFKQPFATETNGNRNQDLTRTIALGLDLAVHNPAAFNNKSTSSTPSADSVLWAKWFAPYRDCPWNQSLANLALNQEFIDYWHGKAKPRALSAAGYNNTFFHYTSFGPYVFPKNGHLHFAVAEVVGYGPGVAADSVWRDAGGASVSQTGYYHPVPSWYDSLTYPGLSAIAGISTMGSAYLQTHELPWYVTAGNGISKIDTARVISIRDVADRAIEMYTGNTLKKYDGVQFKPESTPATGAYGITKTYIPIPAPALKVFTTNDYTNWVVWGPQVEGFTSMPNVQRAIASGRIRAGLSHYLVLRSYSALGPWVRLDSVALRDSRYFNTESSFPGSYVLHDSAILPLENCHYAIESIDSLGGKSGMTNITAHRAITNVGTKNATQGIQKTYALMNNYPNPFNPSTVIRYELALRSLVVLTIYNSLGQSIAILKNEIEEAGTHDVTFDAANLSSGMYFYKLQAGEFVQTKKLLLVR